MSVTLKFCGAAETVTGSCYLLTYPGGQCLIDCGMFQGSKTLKELNYDPFPFNPEEIDFVLLTHAHIDHSGLVPKLIKQGFEGPVYTTAATRDLLSYMLPDSGYIHEREVERLNQRNLQRGREAVQPIYTRHDGEMALESFRAVQYEKWTELPGGMRARFWNAGHILGAASIELEVKDNDASGGMLRLLFSGDIGPEYKMFHPDPDAPEQWDYVFCETTYGDRVRERLTPDARRQELAAEVRDTMSAKGVLLIPAFAVERTQELLVDLSILSKSGQIPSVPIFLDSPLAIRATRVFGAHADELEDFTDGGNLMTNPNIHFTETVDQSKAIHMYSSGVIIMAASGMCDAGRIRHHLKKYLPAATTTLLLVGYQAPATLGSLLAKGVKSVRIQGEDVKVRARIKQLDIYSGHADHDGLIDWVSARLPITKGIFLTHGEKPAIQVFRDDLIGLGIEVEKILIPQLDDEIDLSHGKWIETTKSAKRKIAQTNIGKTDWHNDLAQFSLDLRDALDAAADEKRRAVILRRVQRALAEDG